TLPFPSTTCILTWGARKPLNCSRFSQIVRREDTARTNARDPRRLKLHCGTIQGGCETIEPEKAPPDSERDYRDFHRCELICSGLPSSRQLFFFMLVAEAVAVLPHLRRQRIPLAARWRVSRALA